MRSWNVELARLAPGLVLCSLLAACGGEQPPPNVVLVVLDTLRADVFGYQDSERPLTPFVDRLAAQSAVFPDAFSSSSWTAPSTATLLTGVYPDRHGVEVGFLAQVRSAQPEEGAPVPLQDLRLLRISRKTETLPEFFQARGYQTLGLATNLNIGPEIGFDRGFDRFQMNDDAPAGSLATTLSDWRGELDEERPFFLYLHLNDVHKPYLQRKKWYQEVPGPPERSLYESEVGYLDHWLERLVGEFVGRDDTLLVIASDHGEEFLDHGGMGHHLSLYDEVNRIAFLLHGRGIRPGVQDVAVGGIDLAPTLRELVGYAPSTADHDGRSLVPLIAERTTDEARRARAEELGQRVLLAHRWSPEINLYAAIHDGWKVIRGPLRTQLYDLGADPDERVDLVAEEPERTRALEQAIEAYLARDYEPDSESTSVTLDSALMQTLEDLGYVETD